MEKVKKSGVLSQGDKETEQASIPLTVGQVKELLKKDIAGALMLLTAINDDPDIKDNLAVFIHGKYMNSRHQAELAKQTKIVP